GVIFVYPPIEVGRACPTKPPCTWVRNVRSTPDMNTECFWVLATQSWQAAKRARKRGSAFSTQVTAHEGDELFFVVPDAKLRIFPALRASRRARVRVKRGLSLSAPST